VWYNTAAVKGNSTNDVQGFTNFRVRVQSWVTLCYHIYEQKLHTV
jgi:hypothetical protein